MVVFLFRKKLCFECCFIMAKMDVLLAAFGLNDY